MTLLGSDEWRELSDAERQAETLRRRLDDMHVERHCCQHARAYFGQIVRRGHVLADDEIWDILDPAFESGQLSSDEEIDLTRADVLIQGRSWDDGSDVYLVVEASHTVTVEDVEGAARRAALLSRTGERAIPVVVGETIASEVPQLAQDLQVWQVCYDPTEQSVETVPPNGARGHP